MNEEQANEFYSEVHRRFAELQDFIYENDAEGEFFSVLAVGRYIEGELDDELEISFATNVSDLDEFEEISNSLYESVKLKLDEPKSVDFWIKLFGGDPDKYKN